MAFPIATTKAGGICFAFPDVCLTPPPAAGVPVPYPNIGQLSEAEKTSDGTQGPGEVTVGGDHVILEVSVIQSTTGDEAGTLGGVITGPPPGQKVFFTTFSATVQIHGKGVVRMLDSTEQNAVAQGNANAFGIVLGGVPNVLVGG